MSSTRRNFGVAACSSCSEESSDYSNWDDVSASRNVTFTYGNSLLFGCLVIFAALTALPLYGLCNGSAKNEKNATICGAWRTLGLDCCCSLLVGCIRPKKTSRERQSQRRNTLFLPHNKACCLPLALDCVLGGNSDEGKVDPGSLDNPGPLKNPLYEAENEMAESDKINDAATVAEKNDEECEDSADGEIGNSSQEDAGDSGNKDSKGANEGNGNDKKSNSKGEKDEKEKKKAIFDARHEVCTSTCGILFGISSMPGFCPWVSFSAVGMLIFMMCFWLGLCGLCIDVLLGLRAQKEEFGEDFGQVWCPCLAN